MSSLRTRSRKDPQEEKEKSGDTKAKGQSKKVVVLLRRIDKDSAPMDREIRTARRSGSSKGQGNVEVQGRESSHATRSSSRRSEGDNGAPVISTRTSSRRNEGGDDLEVTGPTRVSSRRIVREKDSDATVAKPGSKRRNDATDKEVVKTRSSSRRRESATVNAVVKTRSSSRRREDAADKAVAGIRSSSSRREEATNKAIAGTRSSSRRREEATNKAIAGTRSSSRIREEATNKSIAGPRSSSRRREETTNKAIAGTRQRSRREEPNKKASVVGSRSSSRRREGANDPKVAGTRSSSRRRETPSDPPVAGPSKLLSRGRENQKPDDNTSSTPTVQVVKTTTTRTRKVERPIAKEVVQKKSSRPRKKRNLGNGEESSQGQIRQEASSPAPSTEEPLLSANIEEVSLSQSSFGASSTPSLSTQNSAVSSQNSQEVATSEPRTASSSVSSVVTALPGIDLFPKPTDNRVVQKQKHKDLPRHLQQILSKIFNEVQEEESLMSRLYARVDKLYNCAEVYGVDFFVERYHATFVNTIWIMVTSVFKNSMPVSKFVTKIWDFIEYCFVRLGWAVEVETGDRNKQRGVLMKGPKSSKYETAAYYAVKLFTKTHGDGSQYSRLCQLKFLETLVSTAAETGNTDFIKFVADTVITAVTIRLKDKSIQCRLKAISILSYFIRLEDVDTRDVVKEIKFYTRYDPSVEIRKLGTTVLAATNMKLRFFYDQAFDKSLSVRYEALKAFVVKRDGDLVRDMGQLNSEKLCKVVIWGMDFSDTRCSDLMTKKILLAWLENSCRNNLTLFLSKLDAYEHMKAVMRILNVLLTEEIVETLDLNFINSTVDSILANDYKNVCIESMVGWLALCSIAQRVQSLAPKVIPDVTKILDVVKCLHKCALLESSVASVENRSEDITPVICLTLALQLTKFVTFEEGNRRHFVKLLQDVLLDPLLDEKPLVVQAVHTLHSYVPHDEYNDIIMSIFQDIFDPKSENVHGNASCAQSMEDVNEDGDVGMADEIEVNRGAGFEEEEVFQNSAAEEPLPEPEEVVRQPMTKYQLTKLREQLCDLKANRLTMQLDKEKMITEKRFVDAIPLVEEIMRLQQKESDMCKEIEEQEALLRNQNARQKVVTNPPNPQRVLTPIPSASGLRVSVAPPQCADEQGESLLEDVDDEAEDEDESNNNASCIINTVEQGLVKGLCMINAHMDLKRPGSVDAFVRNIYDNHLGNFLMESDISIHLNVLKFLTKMALADKRELRKVTRALMRTLEDFTDQTELKHIAYQSLVDLVVSYDYKDFILTDDEKLEEDHFHPYKQDFDRILKDCLGDAEITYENATAQDIQKMFTKLFSDKFQNEQKLSREEQNVLNTTKNQGLLKLMIRGRIRDPSVISMVLELWVNHEYIGTPVLRDLEHALKLFSTFRWWGKDATQTEEAGTNFQLRVLAESLAEATVHLSQERRSSLGDEHIEKFVTYVLGFLDTKDEGLMIHLTNLFLDTIALKPSRSYNDLIVKCAMLIPMKTHEAATKVVNSINGINESLKHHPHTNSVGNLKTAIKKFVAKIKRVFGNDIVQNIRDSNSHSTSDPDDGGIFGDSDDDQIAIENQSNNDELEIQDNDNDGMEIQDNDVMEDPELNQLVSDGDD